jgi:hypothetical protein
MKSAIRPLPIVSLVMYCLLGWYVLFQLPDSGWTYRFLKSGFVFSLLAGSVSAYSWRFAKTSSAQTCSFISKRQQMALAGIFASLVLIFIEFIHPSPSVGAVEFFLSGFSKALSSYYLNIFFGAAVVSLLITIVLIFLSSKAFEDLPQSQGSLTQGMILPFILVFLPLVFISGFLTALAIAIVPSAIVLAFDSSKLTFLQSFSFAGGIGAVVSLIGLRFALYSGVSPGAAILVLFLLIFLLCSNVCSSDAGGHEKNLQGS